MIAIIGCGNPNRGDDGVGPEVLRLLRSRGAGGEGDAVRLLDAGTDGMAVMFAARGASTLILVDACRSGSEPGAVFEAPGSALEAAHQPSFSLHDFRWHNALFVGRKIYAGDFPSDVTVFLIEAGTVELGVGLTPSVAGAAENVADKIGVLLDERRARPETAP
jgi:hydrogenase maturation protease